MNGVFAAVHGFLDSGGAVLWAILLVSVALWSLIVERFMFLRRVYPRLQQDWVDEWLGRADKRSWRATSIRQCIISRARLQLDKTLLIIKTLIGLCPLLGLLGTVTGMIHVFDVMAVTGTGNARAMASGVSRATIPTMAGMVVAIAGLYFSKRIEDRVSDETNRLTDLLRHDS